MLAASETIIITIAAVEQFFVIYKCKLKQSAWVPYVFMIPNDVVEN